MGALSPQHAAILTANTSRPPAHRAPKGAHLSWWCRRLSSAAAGAAHRAHAAHGARPTASGVTRTVPVRDDDGTARDEGAEPAVTSAEERPPQMPANEDDLESFCREALHVAPLLRLRVPRWSDTEIEDVLQVAIVRGIELVRAGHPIRDPRRWLVVTARRLIIDEISAHESAQRHETRTHLEPAHAAAPVTPADQEQDMEAAYRIVMTPEGFEPLHAWLVPLESEWERKAIVWDALLWPEKDIAAALGVSVPVVGKILAKAKRTLRKYWEGKVTHE